MLSQVRGDRTKAEVLLRLVADEQDVAPVRLVGRGGLEEEAVLHRATPWVFR
jgi:hypothetical protein